MTPIQVVAAFAALAFSATSRAEITDWENPLLRTGYENATCPNGVPEDYETCDDGFDNGGDGCGAKELVYWFSDKVIPPRKPGPPGRQIMLADLPPACKTVLEAPGKKTSVATDSHK